MTVTPGFQPIKLQENANFRCFIKICHFIKHFNIKFVTLTFSYKIKNVQKEKELEVWGQEEQLQAYRQRHKRVQA